jgi:hypothetical protein
MSITNAFNALASMTVAGVVANYGLYALPNALTRAHLPCLLVMPLEDDDGIFRQRGEGFIASAFEGGAKTVQLVVSHGLLVAPVATGEGARAHLPTLIAGMEAYLAALKASPTLGGALLEPAHVKLEPKLVMWAGVSYYGCTFRHTWRVAL